ncbi:MAG: hypothetical protein EA379_07005 [Phycisphaerales bacterium]|nr:MAG: hypothetical protein EA379_07005 [Phycisphaerales bacterium]
MRRVVTIYPAASPHGGVIRSDAGEVVASHWAVRPVAPGASSTSDMPELPAGDLFWAWTGGMGEGLFDDDPRTWMGSGRNALDAFCVAARPGLEARGGRLLLRPHHAHALGDVPSCLRLLREQEGGPFALLLDPVAMLAQSMRADAQDHFTRMAHALAGVSDGVVIDGADEDLAMLLLEALGGAPINEKAFLAVTPGASETLRGRVAAIAAQG